MQTIDELAMVNHLEKLECVEQQLEKETLQRDRFERLWKLAGREAKEARVELFFSLCLTHKLAQAAQGTPGNASVQELYEEMVAEHWPVAEWNARINSRMAAHQ